MRGCVWDTQLSIFETALATGRCDFSESRRLYLSKCVAGASNNLSLVFIVPIIKSVGFIQNLYIHYTSTKRSVKNVQLFTGCLNFV